MCSIHGGSRYVARRSKQLGSSAQGSTSVGMAIAVIRVVTITTAAKRALGAIVIKLIITKLVNVVDAK